VLAEVNRRKAHDTLVKKNKHTQIQY